MLSKGNQVPINRQIWCLENSNDLLSMINFITAWNTAYSAIQSFKNNNFQNVRQCRSVFFRLVLKMKKLCGGKMDKEAQIRLADIIHVVLHSDYLEAGDNSFKGFEFQFLVHGHVFITYTCLYKLGLDQVFFFFLFNHCDPLELGFLYYGKTN